MKHSEEQVNRYFSLMHTMLAGGGGPGGPGGALGAATAGGRGAGRAQQPHGRNPQASAMMHIYVEHIIAVHKFARLDLDSLQ